MIHAAAISDQFVACLDHSRAAAEPYRHWLLRDVFPRDVCNAIEALPCDPPRIEDTAGKRETHSATRIFFAAENRARFDVCRELAAALQDEATIRKLEGTCGAALKGGFLRIEYCQDTAGFWLEPHTDIGVKLFTMLVYLSTDPGSEKWGTDIFDENLNHVATAPYQFNWGLIFIPGANTWHGFRKRPINGVRRSLIVNYVKGEWRDRHQLAYPDQAVG